jgi:hypothetical protein
MLCTNSNLSALYREDLLQAQHILKDYHELVLDCNLVCERMVF